MRNLREKHGITLIALIITVIVLLILAGTAISISVNSTDLFNKSNAAKESWNAGVREEESSITDVLDVLDIAANPDSARAKLTVRVNDDETVESPYYVYYPSKKYIEESGDENCKGIKCRVLYNDKTYGLQIVSAKPVTNIALAKDDPNPNIEGEMGSVERAQNSYNRVITTLNEKTEEYIATINDEILATDARSMGSNPLNKNYPDNLTGEERQAAMYTSSAENLVEYSGRFFDTDDNYLIDRKRSKAIGTWEFDGGSGEHYWVASRKVSELNGFFSIYFVNPNGFANNTLCMWSVNDDGTANAPRFGEGGVRPVFILSPNVKIIGGEGTEEVPYEIGL